MYQIILNKYFKYFMNLLIDLGLKDLFKPKNYLVFKYIFMFIPLHLKFTF